jgi:phenylacetate-CoA ligase
MQAPPRRLRLQDWRWPLWRAQERVRGRHATNYYAELMLSQYWTWDQHAAAAEARIAELLTQASEHVPYYRALGCGTTLDKYPVLTRQGLLRNTQTLLSERAHGELMTKYSSGTTGDRVAATRDWRMQEMNDACIWRGDGWGSTLAPSDRQLHLRIDPRHLELPPGLLGRMTSLYYNRYWLCGYVVNREIVRNVHQALHRLRPQLLCSYTGTLLAYVHLARELKLKPPPLEKIVLIAEELPASDAAEFLDFFGCRAYSRYGANELGVIADQCEYGALHAHCEHVWLEVLTTAGTVTSRGAGVLLCTCLSNLAMPLIRYEIGDWAELSAKPCPCGRGLPVLARLEGRAGQFVYGSDGRWINAHSFLEPLYQKPVRAVRVIQDQPGRMRVLLEDSRLTPVDCAEVLERFAGMHGGSLQVELISVDEMPPTPSGKRCSAQCMLARPENFSVLRQDASRSPH